MFFAKPWDDHEMRGLSQRVASSAAEVASRLTRELSEEAPLTSQPGHTAAGSRETGAGGPTGSFVMRGGTSDKLAFMVDAYAGEDSEAARLPLGLDTSDLDQFGHPMMKRRASQPIPNFLVRSQPVIAFVVRDQSFVALAQAFVIMIGQQYRGSWPQGNHHGPPHQRGRQVSQEQILERIHGNLYSIVGEAVDDVKVEEDKWSRTEIVKRIVGYIYKAAKTPDLMHKPWQEASAGWLMVIHVLGVFRVRSHIMTFPCTIGASETHQKNLSFALGVRWQQTKTVCPPAQISKTIVHHGMGSYVSACSERPWFYQLALGNAFTSAVWELVQASARGRPQVHFQDVQDFVVREFEQHLDKSLLTKAVWDATMLTFKDRDIQPKIFKAVHNTYQPALDELLADTRPIDDARKVETFTRRWMETSMQRAWSALESAEQVLTSGQVIRLFQNLIAPFGEGHEYTCIPSMLVDQIGRPPRNWKFLRTAVSKMFDDWHAAQAAPQPSKRRKKGHGGGEGGRACCG
eukprot:s3127_g4.t1